MVSRRTFLSISIIMLIVFFMFMFTTVATDVLNNYEVNEFAGIEGLFSGKDSYEVKKNGEGSSSGTSGGSQHTGTDIDNIEEGDEVIVYLGESLDEGAGDLAYNWSVYMKWDVVLCRSFSELDALVNSGIRPQLVLIDPDVVQISLGTIEKMEGYAEEGINLIFEALPSLEDMARYPALMDLLGIKDIREESTTVSGIHLYSDLFIGDEIMYLAANEEQEEKYQDMDLTFPWIELTSGTKTYMKGIPEDESVETEDYPVIIWRKSFEKGYVFVVNGSYLEDMTGLGILTGMWYETESYILYPVINSQNLVVVNYPELAEENTEEMMEIYSDNLRGIYKNTVWAALSALYERNHIGISFMMTPQFDYEDEELPNRSDLTYYLKLINELDGETGISTFTVSDTNVMDKLDEDESLWEDIISGYKFSALYAPGMEDQEVENVLSHSLLDDIRTVVGDYGSDSQVVGYLTDEVTKQSFVVDGQEYSYSADFRHRSVDSALGYANIYVDISVIAYPEGEEDHWEKVAENLSSGVNALMSQYTGFEGTTVSEADGRIRNYLALDYSEEREDNKITLNIENVQDTVWFVLRTHGEEITAIEGGTYTLLEENAYLIEASESEVVIEVEKTDSDLYYYIPED